MTIASVEGLVRELRKQIRGDVLTSEADRERYARDESIFSIVPLVIVAPKDEEDLRAVVLIARRFQVPITPRGGGTSVAGGSIGAGVVIDFSKHMNSVLDVSEDRVLVQPGVVLDRLNSILNRKGRRIAPDPASRADCTLGGMVGTNASGPHAFKHGDTRHSVTRLRLILSDGSVADSGGLSGRFGDLSREIGGEREKVLKAQRPTAKNSSGYALPSLLGTPPDFTQLLVGSEGTLALFSEIELRTIPLPAESRTVVFPFETMDHAMEAVLSLRVLGPAAIELVDGHILDALAGIEPGIAERLGLISAQASLWVEWEGEIPGEALSGGARPLKSSREAEHLWDLRSKASKALQERGGRKRPLRCIEDGVVPPAVLPGYVSELREILRLHGCDGAIFGHAGDAHIHVNPMIDVQAPGLLSRLDGLMDDAYGLVLRMGGSISGEHGDGLLRSRYVAAQWKSILPLFRRVKETFDPESILNPGKKLQTSESPTVSLRPDLAPAATPFCMGPTRRRMTCLDTFQRPL
jgi:FAD/FMN-containing dehydrogenase